MSARDRLKLLGDRADPLTKCQAEAEEDAEREAREKQEARGRASVSPTIAALQAEIIELRAYVVQRDQEYLKMTETLIEGFDKIESWTRKTIEARVLHSEAAMCARISERFGELRGQISAIDPTRAKNDEPFKFANERARDDDIPELPNFLPARAIN